MRINFLGSISLFLVSLLAGCSTLLATVGTEEEILINAQSTQQTLKETLGAPLQFEILSEPIAVYELRKTVPQLYILEGLPRSRASHDVQPPQVVAWARYRFMGRLQRNHDVGEALSINLMTFGLLEPALTVAMLKDRSIQRAHLLTVWFDSGDRALAYVWTKPLCEDSSQDSALCKSQEE